MPKKNPKKGSKHPRIVFSSVEQLMAYYFPNEAIEKERPEGTKRGALVGKQILTDIRKTVAPHH